MTEDELAREPGAVATRSEDEPVDEVPDVVFTPMDFRLNLQARLAEPIELTNLDNPLIRKLTWEQVIPERGEPAAEPGPAEPAADEAPSPRRVLPPLPPLPEVPVDPPVAQPSAERSQEATPERPQDPAPAAEPVASDATPPVAAIQPPPPPPPVGEVNRLASVPDMVVDDSPIDLPPITPSGPVAPYSTPVAPYSTPVAPVAPPVRSLYTPVLPETVFVVTPRPPAPNVAAIVAESNLARHRSSRKHRRGFARSLMSVLMIFGMLGGGALAAKKFLLREPEWPVQLKPLATDVATARDLKFKDTVTVTPLPIADYAKHLGASVMVGDAGAVAGWRALGLVSGELDVEAIGRQALNDAPAFYDPATTTIFVIDDLAPYEHLYRYAMHRALTNALLDQHFHWSSRLATASPAGALALRSTIDGDALAVADTLSIGDAPDQLAPELLSFAQAHAGPLAPSQYAAIVTGRLGVVMRPTIAALSTDRVALAALEEATPSSDAAFDLARPESSVPAAAGTQGLMFWYYVLADRIDDTQAWSSVLRWAGDSLKVVPATTGACVDATVDAVDADGAAVLLSAFQAWAASAPPESTTTVAAGAGNQVAIHACDPGATVAATIAPKVPVAFGGAAVERELVAAATSAASQTKVDAACLVAAARQRGTALVSPTDDAPIVATDWQPAYVATNLDLATGCVAPAG